MRKKGALVGNMRSWISKNELKQSNACLHTCIKQLNEEIANLRKILADTRQERDEALDDARIQRSEKIAYMELHSRVSAEETLYFSKYIDAQTENKALRQILEDLTGKDVDDLIEAHNKATRLLAYEEVKEKTNE